MNNLKKPEDLIELMKDSGRRKKLTEDDWLDIGNWMRENITKDKVSEDVYKKFWPLGIGEVIGMICDGINYKRKTGRYASKRDVE